MFFQDRLLCVILAVLTLAWYTGLASNSQRAFTKKSDVLSLFFNAYVEQTCAPLACLVPKESRRGHQIPQNWSYRWL